MKQRIPLRRPSVTERAESGKAEVMSEADVGGSS